MDLTPLRTKRSNLANEASAILDGALKAGRANTPEEKEKLTSIEREIADLKETIERAERNADVQRELGSFKPTIDATTSEPMQKDLNKNYSILRAIKARVNNEALSGIEREYNDEIVKRTGKQPRGFYFPGTITRDIFNTTTAAGAKQVVVQPTFIDKLRNKTLLNQLGVTYLTNLVGQVKIPKKTANTAAYWVSEGNAVTASNPTMGQVEFNAKTVGGYTDISRQLFNQTSLDVENLILEDLATTIAVDIDSKAFNGTGADGQPLGLLNNTNVAAIARASSDNGKALSYADIVHMESVISAANADIATLNYVTNAVVRGKLKVTPKVDGYPLYVWSEDNKLNGYGAFASNQIPSNLTKGTGTNLSAILFGNFADLVVGQWGTLDIQVDTTSLGTSGGVRIIALQDVDIQLRRAESFTKIVDAITA